MRLARRVNFILALKINKKNFSSVPHNENLKFDSKQDICSRQSKNENLFKFHHFIENMISEITNLSSLQILFSQLNLEGKIEIIFTFK